jgi:hypothetical protein
VVLHTCTVQTTGVEAAEVAPSRLDWPATLRPFFVILQGASVLITWPLWQARDQPPLLPVLESLPQIDYGLLLLASLALILYRPVLGVIVHVGLLLIAFASDQTRLQPEFVSLAIILAGTTTIPYAGVVARAHLVALWFWAGLNKALSLGFMGDSAQWLFNASPLRLEALRDHFGWLIIASEISVGLCLLVPRARKVGVVLAVALHGYTLVTLVGVGWNESVWPWNIALALAAPAFFWSAPVDQWTTKSLAILLAFAIVPIGFYAGYVDAYLAHNLYTSNTATAEVCDAEGLCSPAVFDGTWTDLRVPLPPEPRLFVDYFNEVCSPGDRLLLEPRRTRVTFGRDTETAVHQCPGQQ